MNLQELRDIQDQERSTDSLQSLPSEFYADVGTYIRELRADRAAAAERAEDPFDSQEVAQLSDEIRTAERVATSIYERRLGKILSRASMAAADVGGNIDGLTAEEEALYDDLVARIRENKQSVLGILGDDGERDTEVPGELDTDIPSSVQDPPSETEASQPDQVDAVESEPDSPESAVEEPEHADEGLDDHTTVQVTDDVGEVFGVDERIYTLEKDDVVTLPTENAEALVERGAAEIVD